MRAALFIFSRRTARIAAIALPLAATLPAHAAPTLVDALAIPGDATDLLPGAGAGVSRLSFGSDLSYDRSSHTFYGLPDRGPGGGLYAYATRFQQFSLQVDPSTGAISGITITRTVPLTDASGAPYTGRRPEPVAAPAAPSPLGRSFDPEGIAVRANGNVLVSDEYGPSIREFDRDGRLVREFAMPANLLPRQPDGATNFVDGRPVIAAGRQDNRGFEGLTLSPDGSRLYAALQGPLVEEGAPDGRHGRIVRLVEFDVATGQPMRQFGYPLEPLAEINARLPADAAFGADAQGRDIGLSAIAALDADRFLVLERDNRGIGVDDPTGSAPVGSKRLYLIDLSGATDIRDVSLAGRDDLPADVVPVSKVLYADLAALLGAAGLPVPEKFEGLALGPRLADGSRLLLLATDNDFSVTQTGAGEQRDVCTGGATVALDAGCPAGTMLLPSYLYVLRDTLESPAGPCSRPPTRSGFRMPSDT